MAFTALHVGDLHFWRIPLNPLHYLGKRLLGNANLLLRRARKFRLELAPNLVARLADLHPDYLLLSGDFTTTALSAEFELAKQALAPLQTALPGRVLAAPGNHDCYTIRSIRYGAFNQHLGKWVPGGGTWPAITELEPGVPLVAINAGTSNGLDSFGRFRAADAEVLRKWWQAAHPRPRELFVLCHFPAEVPAALVAKESRGPQFLDTAPLMEFLRETGVPIWFLHGHYHHRWVYASPTIPRLTYLNAGAPLMRRSGRAPDLGFFEIRHEGGATSLAVHTRETEIGPWTRTGFIPPAQGEYRDLQAFAKLED